MDGTISSASRKRGEFRNARSRTRSNLRGWTRIQMLCGGLYAASAL